LFEKKDIIFSETLGVCKVHEVTKLAAKNGEPIPYYGLRSVFDNKKVSYIPIEKHKVLLRELISVEEARRLKDNSAPEDLSELQRQEIEYVLSNAK
jgi:hypothetical protein